MRAEQTGFGGDETKESVREGPVLLRGRGAFTGSAQNAGLQALARRQDRARGVRRREAGGAEALAAPRENREAARRGRERGARNAKSKSRLFPAGERARDTFVFRRKRNRNREDEKLPARHSRRRELGFARGRRRVRASLIDAHGDKLGANGGAALFGGRVKVPRRAGDGRRGERNRG